jgi:hypothetical protein
VKNRNVIALALLIVAILIAVIGVSGCSLPGTPDGTLDGGSKDDHQVPGQENDQEEDPDTNPTEPSEPADDPAPNPADDPTLNPADDPAPNPADDPVPNPADDPVPNPADDPEYAPYTGLSGTKWLWGTSLLEFGDTEVVFRENRSYPYSAVDPETGIGVIQTLGSYKISEDTMTLEIMNYRNSQTNLNLEENEDKEYNAVFTRQKIGPVRIPANTLVGTEWNLGDNGEPFLGVQWIIFLTETTVLNQSASGVFVDDYTYNTTTKKGWIYFINNFEIRDKGETLYIVNYKGYGHTMTCTRVH